STPDWDAARSDLATVRRRYDEDARMTNQEELVDYLRWVTTDLHETRARLRGLEEREREPIAIVAMACRLPGGLRSPEDLWRLLVAGRPAPGRTGATRRRMRSGAGRRRDGDVPAGGPRRALPARRAGRRRPLQGVRRGGRRRGLERGRGRAAAGAALRCPAGG